MPLDNMGPIQFQIVGTFMEKPRLIVNGEEVPYQSLTAAYYPEETVEYGEEKETYPEQIALAFSLSSKMGQLEANVMYRVRANAEGKLVLAKEDKKMPPWMKDKKKKDEKSSKDEEEKSDKDKKSKGTTVKFRLVQEEPLDRDPLRNEILKNLVKEDE